MSDHKTSDHPTPPDTPADPNEADKAVPEAANPAPHPAGGSGDDDCPDQGRSSGPPEQVKPPADEAADTSTNNDDIPDNSNDYNPPHDSAEDPKGKGMANSYLDEVVPEADPKTQKEMGFK